MPLERVVASQQIGINLNDVTSQCTSVNPRAGAAHSLMLESQRNGAHLGGIMHVGEHNLDRRSVSGNMFNRLGKGVDMRETFNRRREQECSQHLATQRVRSEVHSQGVRDIPLDDL